MKNIEDFLNLVWKKKLWTITILIGIFCLNFIITNYSSLKKEYLVHIQTSKLLNETLSEEQENQNIVWDSYKSAFEDIPLIVNYFNEVNANHDNNFTISPKSKEKGIEIVQQVNKKIHQQISRSKGILLINNSYQELHFTMLNGMKEALEFSKNIEKYFNLDSYDMASTQQIIEQYNNLMLYNLSIAKSVLPQFNQLIQNETNEIEQNILDAENMLNKIVFLVLSFIYLALLIVIIIWKYVKYHMNTLKNPKEII